MIPSSLPKRWRDVPSRVYCDGGLFKSSSLFSASLRRFLISSKSASKHFTPQQFQGLVATIQRKLHDKVPDRLGQLGNDPGWPYKNEAVLNPDYARVDPEVQRNHTKWSAAKWKTPLKKKGIVLVTQTILKNPQNTGAMVALCWSCSFRYPASFSVASATAFNRSHESDLKVDKKSGDLKIFQRCPILRKS